MRAPSSIRLAQDEAGSATVEFALVSIPLIMLILGIGSIALMLYTNAALHWAVENSARTAAMQSNVTQSQIQTQINNYLSSLGIPNAAVSYSVAAGVVPVAHITATFSRTFTIPMVHPIQVDFSADTYTPQGAAP
jgi:Flp pilus assembly protein TadG